MHELSLPILSLLALAPILLVGVLLIGLRWSAAAAMPLAFALTLGLALLVWQVPLQQVVAASLKGWLVAATLMYIIFGAMLLLETLELGGALPTIRRSLTSITPDRRLQVILVAWLFGSFIEGASGFGTPAAVCVPLLVGLGFPGMAAATAGMLIQSTPVSFGAAGTPILLGVRTGLGDDAGVAAWMQAEGFGQMSDLLWSIAVKVACLHATLGTLIPLMVVCTMTRYFGPHRSWRDGLAVWPFALFAACAMTIPYLLTAWFLGPEFPALIGSLVGLITVSTAARHGWFLVGSHAASPWDFGPADQWPGEWSGRLWVGMVAVGGALPDRPMSMFRAWLPYALVAGCLLLSRLVPGLQAALKSWVIAWPGMLGSNVDLGRIEPLYLPGTIFVVVSLASAFLYRIPIPRYGAAWRKSGRVVLSASLALVCAVPMVQVIIHSDSGLAGYPKMPVALAEGVAQAIGRGWPLLAPTIGGLGAFVAGSNTVSNMMFSLFQFNVAQRIGIDPTWGVALQAVGGAAGNMICVHNVVAACAVIGLHGREGWVLQRTWLPFLYYAGGAGLLGLAVAYGFIGSS